MHRLELAAQGRLTKSSASLAGDQNQNYGRLGSSTLFLHSWRAFGAS